MFRNHRHALILLVFGVTGLLSGCAASRATQYTKFVDAFLPSSPKYNSIDPAPTLSYPRNASLYTRETASMLLPLPASSPLDEYFRKADEHFAAGKRFYESGDPKGARREFDQAMDSLLSTPAELPDRQRLERKLDQMADAIFRYDVEGLGAGQSRDEIVYDKPPLDGMLEMTFPVDPNLKPKVDEELRATISQLPLELSDPVLSFIHYFSTDRGHKILEGGLRRSGRYRSMIERVLTEEGVPKELIYLAQEESGFSPRAKSVKSCLGLWQFAAFRGQEYGLTQNGTVDERMDPEKSTRAAARHLRDLYQHFGDWYLAMAAYNCGPGCVDRAIQRTGYADFWDLHRLNALPQETKNYVPLILALTIMSKNPQDYGMNDVDPDPPAESEQVQVKAPTSLTLVADAVGATVSELQDLNPSLLKGIAPEGFALRIPKGASAELDAALAQVPLEHRASWRLHRVEAGDTIAGIAKRFSSAAKLIADANEDGAGELTPGKLLIVPVSYHPAPKREGRIKARTSSRKHSYAKAPSRSRAHVYSKKTSKGAYATASLRSSRHSGTRNR